MIGDTERRTLSGLSGSELRTHLTSLWLKSPQTGYFLTLSFNRRFAFERGFSDIDRFFQSIMRGAHGQRWHKRTQRSMNFEVYGFCEHVGTNVHFHLGVWAEKEELQYLRDHGREEWLRLQPQGDFAAEPIQQRIAAADYSHKTVRDRNSQESLYLYLFPDKARMDQAKDSRKPNKERNRAQIWRNSIQRGLKRRGKESLTKKKRAKLARYGGDGGQDI